MIVVTFLYIIPIICIFCFVLSYFIEVFIEYKKYHVYSYSQGIKRIPVCRILRSTPFIFLSILPLINLGFLIFLLCWKEDVEEFVEEFIDDCFD